MNDKKTELIRKNQNWSQILIYCWIIITVIRLILSITKTINCWSNFKIKIILKINNEIAAKINWFVDESGIENVLAQWINSGFIPTTNQINLNAAIEWCRFSCLVDCSKFNSANEFRFHCRYEIRMNLAEFAASTATELCWTIKLYFNRYSYCIGLIGGLFD